MFHLPYINLFIKTINYKPVAKVIHFITTAKFPTQKNKVFANFCTLKLQHSGSTAQSGFSLLLLPKCTPEPCARFQKYKPDKTKKSRFTAAGKSVIDRYAADISRFAPYFCLKCRLFIFSDTCTFVLRF
jgi:hypothetical protein